MEEKSFKVIVDSMADFEIGYKNPNLVIVDTPVYFGDEEVTGISPDEFYRKQQEIFEQRQNIPIKTSAPKTEDIMNAILDILRAGKDAIYVATASPLTSAFTSGKSAIMAIEDLGEKFENRAIVIDGLSMSALTSVLVRHAMTECNETDEFLEYIFDRRNDTEHIFFASEFTAYQRSGRISEPVLAFLKVARIKAMMRFDFVKNVDKERYAYAANKDFSLKKLFKKAVDMMEETIDERFCMVIHGDNSKDASTLHSMINERMPDVVTLFNEQKTRMGAATGVHLGYTGVGLAFLRKKGVYPEAEKHREKQRFLECVYEAEFD